MGRVNGETQDRHSDTKNEACRQAAQQRTPREEAEPDRYGTPAHYSASTEDHATDLRAPDDRLARRPEAEGQSVRHQHRLRLAARGGHRSVRV